MVATGGVASRFASKRVTVACNERVVGRLMSSRCTREKQALLASQFTLASAIMSPGRAIQPWYASRWYAPSLNQMKSKPP